MQTAEKAGGIGPRAATALEKQRPKCGLKAPKAGCSDVSGQVTALYNFRDIDTYPDSVGRRGHVLGVAGTKPGGGIGQTTPIGSVHVSNYPSFTTPKHISGLMLSLTLSAGPLVKALAVLWSVFRLYDLLTQGWGCVVVCEH